MEAMAYEKRQVEFQGPPRGKCKKNFPRLPARLRRPEGAYIRCKGEEKKDRAQQHTHAKDKIQTYKERNKHRKVI